MTLRLGWINDYQPGSHAGGSLRTQERAASFAPAEVEVVWGGPDGVPEDCDFYVLNSCTFLGREQVRFLCGVPHVLWLHDLWLLPPAQQWIVGDGYLRALCDSARRVVFLSRLHEWAFKKCHYQALPASKTKLAPCMVDPAPFEELPAGPRLEGRAFWMGTFDRYRGVRLAAEWAEQEGVALDMYGFGDAPPYLARQKHVRVLPPVAQADVPAVMALYETCACASSEVGSMDEKRAASEPPFVEACGRVAVEATLAGCKVVHNGRLGAASWPWFGNRDATAAAMRHAPAQFWDMLMAAVLE
jgi:hypothetical protein